MRLLTTVPRGVGRCVHHRRFFSFVEGGAVAVGVQQSGERLGQTRRVDLQVDEPPAPYGSELTCSGASSRSSLTATTFAVIGAYRSDVDLVDSTLPNSLPAVDLGADRGQFDEHHVTERGLGDSR